MGLCCIVMTVLGKKKLLSVQHRGAFLLILHTSNASNHSYTSDAYRARL